MAGMPPTLLAPGTAGVESDPNNPDLITQVRNQLVETTARFWTNVELLAIMKLGIADLWGAILDLHQDHFLYVNNTDVVLRANATQIDGVPSDCFRIQLIEPRDTTVNAAGHQVLFIPAKYKSQEFIVARTQPSQDPASIPSRVIYYTPVGLGPPAEPMRIMTGPMINADLNLRLTYTPLVTIAETNPIPGLSDNALKAWTIAYARAKETEDRQPDIGWLKVYATEKQEILTRLTPRQEQEVEVVEDVFQGFGSLW